MGLCRGHSNQRVQQMQKPGERKKDNIHVQVQDGRLCPHWDLPSLPNSRNEGRREEEEGGRERKKEKREHEHKNNTHKLEGKFSPKVLKKKKKSMQPKKSRKKKKYQAVEQ